MTDSKKTKPVTFTDPKEMALAIYASKPGDILELTFADTSGEEMKGDLLMVCCMNTTTISISEEQMMRLFSASEHGCWGCREMDRSFTFYILNAFDPGYFIRKTLDKGLLESVTLEMSLEDLDKMSEENDNPNPDSGEESNNFNSRNDSGKETETMNKTSSNRGKETSMNKNRNDNRSRRPRRAPLTPWQKFCNDMDRNYPMGRERVSFFELYPEVTFDRDGKSFTAKIQDDVSKLGELSVCWNESADGTPTDLDGTFSMILVRDEGDTEITFEHDPLDCKPWQVTGALSAWLNSDELAETGSGKLAAVKRTLEKDGFMGVEAEYTRYDVQVGEDNDLQAVRIVVNDDPDYVIRLVITVEGADVHFRLEDEFGNGFGSFSKDVRATGVTWYAREHIRRNYFSSAR